MTPTEVADAAIRAFLYVEWSQARLIWTGEHMALVARPPVDDDVVEVARRHEPELAVVVLAEAIVAAAAQGIAP